MDPSQPQYNPQPVTPQPQPQPLPTTAPEQFAQPQPVNPVQPAAAPQSLTSEKFTKKVRGAGRSIFIFGIFVAVFTALGIIVSITHAPKEASSISNVLFAYAGIAVFLGSAITMIIQGRTLKSAANLQVAQRAIIASLIACIALLTIDVASSIMSHSGLSIIGFLALVTAIYLLVTKSGIKKLA